MHAGLGRTFRSFGQLIVDPVDNFRGRRELRRILTCLELLSEEDWKQLPQLTLIEEWFLRRIVECVRRASKILYVWLTFKF